MKNRIFCAKRIVQQFTQKPTKFSGRGHPPNIGSLHCPIVCARIDYVHARIYPVPAQRMVNTISRARSAAINIGVVNLHNFQRETPCARLCVSSVHKRHILDLTRRGLKPAFDLAI